MHLHAEVNFDDCAGLGFPKESTLTYWDTCLFLRLARSVGKYTQNLTSILAQVMADPNNPSRYVLGLLDGGLTLPDPSMYSSLTHRDAMIRNGYHVVIQKVGTSIDLSFCILTQ